MEFFLVSAFFAFVLEKVIVKCLISILTISQRSPLFSRSLYLSIICGIFSAIVAACVLIKGQLKSPPRMILSLENFGEYYIVVNKIGAECGDR